MGARPSAPAMRRGRPVASEWGSGPRQGSGQLPGRQPQTLGQDSREAGTRAHFQGEGSGPKVLAASISTSRWREETSVLTSSHNMFKAQSLRHMGQTVQTKWFNQGWRNSGALGYTMQDGLWAQREHSMAQFTYLWAMWLWPNIYLLLLGLIFFCKTGMIEWPRFVGKWKEIINVKCPHHAWERLHILAIFPFIQIKPQNHCDL